MSNRILFTVIGVAIALGILSTILHKLTPAPTQNGSTQATTTTASTTTTCTADAMQCPDGSYVGRTGPHCEFVCPELPTVPSDVQAAIDAKADLINVSSPRPLTKIQSPFHISGMARGNWFFEASAPVLLTDSAGRIIAKGTIHAEGNWMTSDFVPFSTDLTFVSPYKAGMPDATKKGTLIFKKDNPSGDPKNDDSLEIPVMFSE